MRESQQLSCNGCNLKDLLRFNMNICLNPLLYRCRTKVHTNLELLRETREAYTKTIEETEMACKE